MAPSSADEPREAPVKSTAQHESEPADRTLSGVKRKEMERRKRPSFKAIGHLVMAMRRFTDSLNPTYTYGKRTTSSSGGGSKLVSEDVEAAAVTSAEKKLNRPPSKGRAPTPDGHEPVKYAYSSHGHKFDFLLKPLPPTEEEEAVR